MFARVAPQTLRPRSPQVVLGEYHDAWTFSPDGSRVAFGISSPAANGVGPRVGVRIVDVTRMTATRDVSTGIAAEALGWLAPRRLVALLQSGELNLIDPDTGAILSRQSVGPFKMQCVPQPSAITRRGFVLLLASRGRTPSRLLLVTAQGRVRTVPLPRVPLGGNCGRGGLALDDAGSRAFVFGRGSLVAEIDLSTMQVTYHRVAAHRSAPARRRGALWLGNGVVAVFGQDKARSPMGVEVINTKTWTSRSIQRNAGAARSFARGLLVYDAEYDPDASRRGIGLRAYRPDGRKLFHVLGREKVWDVQVAGSYAYAFSATLLHVVDLNSGKVVSRSKHAGVRTELVKVP